jgi:hypothetical protein
VLFLDTDVIANPLTGKNVFEAWDPERVGLVSQRYAMPYEYFDTAKRICFQRNRFVTPDYPLDSVFLFTLEQVYANEGFEGARRGVQVARAAPAEFENRLAVDRSRRTDAPTGVRVSRPGRRFSCFHGGARLAPCVHERRRRLQF